MLVYYMCYFFFFKQKTAYEMRISDWSSDVCSSDLHPLALLLVPRFRVESRWVAPQHSRQGEFPRLYGRKGRRAAADPLRSVAEAGVEIGRASCRERVCQYVSISVVAGALKKKNEQIDLIGSRSRKSRDKKTN